MWIVVPNLLEARDQLNARFPHRDKGAEGTIGDTAHQAAPSSHNPDLTGSPEYRDGDKLDEVRAADFDKDLNDPITMEQVVQHWVTLARTGAHLQWVRYFIYNRRIWQRSDNFVSRTYNGSNPHTDHVHVNSDFGQWADTVTGTNWHLDAIGTMPGSTPPPPPAPVPSSSTLKSGATGEAVRKVQRFLLSVFPTYRNSVNVRRGVPLVVDGNFGPQTVAWVEEFQRRTGLTDDGIVGPKTFAAMRKYGYK
jgi:hypothetical protein